MTLGKFCVAVNALAKDYCDHLNAECKAGRALFGSAYHPYGQRMLSFFFERGYTPKAAFDEIRRGDR